MFDRYIAPVLTFSVLIAGHVVIASALLGAPKAPSADSQQLVRAKPVPVVQLDTVIVTGKRAS